jgi:polyvinyl alcohol dehydrogenase (cytochrome)
MTKHAPILIFFTALPLFAQSTCPQNAGLGDWSGRPNWNGWGASITNARFQSATGAQLAPNQAARLKLKWAFGFPGAKAVYGQPTVAGGRVFLGVDTGSVYSIDASTGCLDV